MGMQPRPTGARRAAPWLLGVVLLLGAVLTGVLWLFGGETARTTPAVGAAPALAQRAPLSGGAPHDLDAPPTPEPARHSDTAEAETRVGLAALSATDERTWTGGVYDAEDSSPIADARVALSLGERERAVQTDAEGRFELTWPADLAAQLEIAHARYVDVRAPAADLEHDAEFGLWRSARLTGRVYPAPDSPGGSATIWHQTASSQRYWHASEQPLTADGSFAFEDLAPGEYVLGARVTGRAVAPEAGLQLGPGEQLEVALEARLGAQLSGRVLLTPQERGLADVRLVLEPRDDDLPRDWRRDSTLEMVSDAGGRFRFEGLAPGNWRLRAESSWGADTWRDLTVSESGERLETELSISAYGRLGGRVLDAGGRPVAGCELALFGNSRQSSAFLSGQGEALTSSDAEGWFKLEPVATRERLQLAARAPAGSSVQSFQPLDPGENRMGLVLTLEPDHSVRGRVLSGAGEPIVGALIEVYTRLDARTTHSARGESDAEGRFEVGGLPAAGGYVRASAEGWLQAGLAVEYEVGEVELVLAPAWRLQGLALDSQGFAIPDLPLSLEFVDPEASERSNRRERRNTSSDAFGRFEFEGLPDGRWNLSGSSYLWALEGEDPRAVELPADSYVELRFAPRARPERATLEGEVVRTDGAAPTGVEVEGLRGGVLTVNGGRFRASGVTPTRQRLTLRADGHAGVTLESIDLVPGGYHDVGRVVLEPATFLVVRVTAKDGGDLNGARVRLIALPTEEGGKGRQSPSVRFNSARRGRYETRDATRYAWRLIVDRSGYQRVNRRIEVKDQERQTITVEMEPDA